MYGTIYELPTDVRNCFDEDDQQKFIEYYNMLDPKTEDEVYEAMKSAWRACAELPSSFSFHAIASADMKDKDNEKVNIESAKKKMDEFIRYGGNLNWEHRDLVTGKVWDWAPAQYKGHPAIQIWGNLYGGRDIYDAVRREFAQGKNGMSLGGQAPYVGYKCDSEGCYIMRDVDNIFEISITKNPANPLAETLDFNKGAFAKSADHAEQEGIDLSIQTYTIHRDYTTCPIMRVKKDLEKSGYRGLHATKEGVTMPATWCDDVLMDLIGQRGYVLMKCEGGVMVQDRAWATEKAFKDGFTNGYIGADGTILGSITKSQFTDLWSKGLIEPFEGGFRVQTVRLE